ncbi:hypothetical protein FRC04_007911 [Tulasnella sp. 424]|nr:hypothetical protein FRC04_007911 [Tulasnella sp. 424]
MNKNRAEDEDEGDEDIAGRMGRLSMSTPSSTTRVRLCIACKAAHSRAGSSRVAQEEEEEEEESYDAWKLGETQDRRKSTAHTRNRTINASTEQSSFTALAKRPPVCMNCRRNPKVGDSAFCGRRCWQDAVAALGSRADLPSSGKKRRDSQYSQYQNSARVFAVSSQSPTWYQNGYGPDYGQAYQAYPQPLTSYTQPPYPAPQPAYPESQPYYPPMPWPAYPPPPTGSPCAIPGCKATAFSATSRYCGQSCRKNAVTKGLEPACLFCKIYPKDFKKHYCSQKCGQTAENQGPMLLDVPPSDPKYADIVKQFNDSWSRNNAAVAGVVANPTVKRICKVVNSKGVETKYQAYRKQVEAKWSFAAQGKPEGNECRRWHGTQRICTVGDTATNLALCTNAGCRLCSIIRVSFQTSSSVCVGNGIYTSAFSGVSNGYTRVQSVGSPYKAMFLTRIVVGKRHIGGKAPVAGTDSTAVDNIDTELIVFTNDAILPSWLVLYS